jgi:hypothetical protein
LAIAINIPEVIPKVGKPKFNDYFLPLVLALLRDEALEVKSQFINSFAPIFEMISPSSMIETLEPVLLELSKSLVWRVSLVFYPRTRRTVWSSLER